MFAQTTLVGRMGGDAEKKKLNNQDLVQFQIAISNGYYDQSGNWIDKTDWYRISIWRDIKIDRLKKGAIVMVQGALAAKLYKGQDGQSRISLDLRADTFRILLKAQGDNSNEPEATGATNWQQAKPIEKFTAAPQQQEDDLPF